MLRILVTGSNGFIGSHVKKAFNCDGFERNRYDYADIVIHLATHYVKEDIDIDKLIEANIEVGLKLLEKRPSYFIYATTTHTHNLYAATKHAFSKILEHYHNSGKTKAITLKLTDTFGEGDTRNKVFPMWKKILGTGEQMDMSEGFQTLDIVPIQEVVRTIENLVIDRDFYAGSTFLLREAEPMNVRRVAEKVERLTGKKLNLNWGAKQERLIKHDYSCDYEKLVYDNDREIREYFTRR